MARFTLVGVDGNAFSVMGYTARCMKEAKSGDYYNLIAVCDGYAQKANEALGLIDEE